MDRLLLEVRGLKKHFPVIKGLLFAQTVGWVRAVDGIDFTINEGETFGLVGESGCGKTTVAKLVLLLESVTQGHVLFRGKDISKLSGEDLKRYRASVQAVFQDPYSSLDPRMKISSIIAEPLVATSSLPRSQVKERVAELLRQVGLNPISAQLYPHEFSGGQRQRIAVARALAVMPSLVILDEPVSALDVSIRAQIMNLLKDLQRQFQLTYLLIAHDLGTVRYMCSTIGVMYLGKLAEYGASEELFTKPLHPYTQALLSAALPSRPGVKREEYILPGEVPSPINPPSGCRLHPRCWQVKPVCSEIEPTLKQVTATHKVACHLY